MNLVNAALEKGKRSVLGKLRIFTLIEGDLQMLMWIFLLAEEEELIENNKRFAKANYGLWKNYSIETAILEKHLIMDKSLLSMNVTMYNLTDLQSYYDR